MTLSERKSRTAVENLFWQYILRRGVLSEILLCRVEDLGSVLAVAVALEKARTEIIQRKKNTQAFLKAKERNV